MHLGRDEVEKRRGRREAVKRVREWRASNTGATEKEEKEEKERESPELSERGPPQKEKVCAVWIPCQGKSPDAAFQRIKKAACFSLSLSLFLSRERARETFARPIKAAPFTGVSDSIANEEKEFRGRKERISFSLSSVAVKLSS